MEITKAINSHIAILEKKLPKSRYPIILCHHILLLILILSSHFENNPNIIPNNSIRNVLMILFLFLIVVFFFLRLSKNDCKLSLPNKVIIAYKKRIFNPS